MLSDVHVQRLGNTTRIVLVSPAARAYLMRLNPDHRPLYGTTLVVESGAAEPYLLDLQRAGLKILVIH